MDQFALDFLDLRALRSLRALLETCSVTVAARRMHVSQPTMSRTLAALRETLSDPLLVPSGRRLQPTARARSLEPRVDAAIAAIEALVVRDEEPERPSWRIAVSDYGFMVVMAPFLASQDGARTEFDVQPVGVDTIGAVSRGEVDLALAPRVSARGVEGLVFRPLLRDDRVVVMRPHHPLARETLTKKRYLAARHVVVGTDAPGKSLVERALRGQPAREIAFRVGSLSHAIAVVRSTDMVATLPSRFVRKVAPELVTREAPFAIAPLDVNFVFAPRSANDAAHRRLREMLARESIGA